MWSISTWKPPSTGSASRQVPAPWMPAGSTPGTQVGDLDLVAGFHHGGVHLGKGVVEHEALAADREAPAHRLPHRTSEGDGDLPIDVHRVRELPRHLGHQRADQ